MTIRGMYDETRGRSRGYSPQNMGPWRGDRRSRRPHPTWGNHRGNTTLVNQRPSHTPSNIVQPQEIIDLTSTDEEESVIIDATTREQDTLLLDDSTIQETFMTGGNMEYTSDLMTTQSSEINTLPTNTPLSIEDEQGQWISAIANNIDPTMHKHMVYDMKGKSRLKITLEREKKDEEALVTTTPKDDPVVTYDISHSTCSDSQPEEEVQPKPKPASEPYNPKRYQPILPKRLQSTVKSTRSKIMILGHSFITRLFDQIKSERKHRNAFASMKEVLNLQNANVDLLMFGMKSAYIADLRTFQKAIRINNPETILVEMGGNDLCTLESTESLTTKLIMHFKEWLDNYPAVKHVQWARVTYRHKLEKRWTNKKVIDYNKDVDRFNRSMVEEIKKDPRLGHWKHRGLILRSQIKIMSRDGVHMDTTMGKWKYKKSVTNWCKWARLKVQKGLTGKKWWRKKRKGTKERARLLRQKQRRAGGYRHMSRPYHQRCYRGHPHTAQRSRPGACRRGFQVNRQYRGWQATTQYRGRRH